MNELERTKRRTVLKTIPVTVVGGGVVAGTTSASGDRDAESDRPNELDIVAQHDHEAGQHLLELNAGEVSAGWTTITLDNRTEHTHIAYLAKLPAAAIDAADDAGVDPLDYYVEHVTRPFQWFMDDIDPDREPDPDDLSDEYTDLEEGIIFPPWFEDVLPSGGPGLTTGQTTSAVTVDLDPGHYIVECYVKTEDGEFHSYLGMIDLLTVVDERTGAEPEATFDLSLSNDGLDVPDSVPEGRHAVAVRIEEQRIYDHLLGHDVHLIRLDESTTLADVNGWTNWMHPEQLVSDGTEPGTFLGGVQTILTPELLDGTESETAYLHVDLNPGAYAWVAEVPDPAGKGLLEPFIIPFDRDDG